MAHLDGHETSSIPSLESINSNDTDASDTSSDVTEDNFDLDGAGSSILNCDHIIAAIAQSCTPKTLVSLMRVNRQLCDLVAPKVYENVGLRDDAAIRLFFYAATTIEGRLQEGYTGNSWRRSKTELLAFTRVLTLGSHDGNVCAFNVPGAACLTGLHTLRIAMNMNDDESNRLCSHSQCEFLQVLQPRKVVIRNCNGRTVIPLDLRWGLPPCVKTAVLVFPTSPREYYDAESDALTPLTRSLAGKFRLVSRIKIVFWDDFEGTASNRDVLGHYHRRHILVDDLVPLIQNAACTNHRPWPRVTVYGLETLPLKGGNGSALARMYAGLTDPHELVQHALGISHHTLVPSPWTGQKVPYRVPDVFWEEIEAYEEDEDSRIAELDDGEEGE